MTGGNMEAFNNQHFLSYLIKGDLREAVRYLRYFKDQACLLDHYMRIFDQGQPVIRSFNPLIHRLDMIYQDYYRAIFWQEVDRHKAEESLFKALESFCGLSIEDLSHTDVENQVRDLVVTEGFNFLGGKTSPYYGPYIWEKTNREVFQVDLPSGKESYRVDMMEGFVSNSWLDFISLGRVSTGGWVGKDGVMACIRGLYDQSSLNFKVSFLKHEAQHAYDKRVFKNLKSCELEYRAKLVELIYWQGDKKIKMIASEADDTDPDNGHSLASHRIIKGLSKYINLDGLDDLAEQMDKLRACARSLLTEDTNRLISLGQLQA